MSIISRSVCVCRAVAMSCEEMHDAISSYVMMEIRAVVSVS